MVPSLNKLILFFLLFISIGVLSQNTANDVFRPQEYKDQEQFKHFMKRRNAVGKWQINQLKNGALCVRLHNNKSLVESLKKMGKADLAAQKEYEMMAINKNILMAFSKYYTFSKVYFFYSQHSDSVLNGARKGVFLDTNLAIDPTIEMKESFYLIAEKDNVYNSSIGFIPEDKARSVKEMGNSGIEASIVMKNKYGHQLKDPFPVYVTNFSSLNGTRNVNVRVGNNLVPVVLEKWASIERQYEYVSKLNRFLLRFYSQNKDYEVSDPTIRPFLY